MMSRAWKEENENCLFFFFLSDKFFSKKLDLSYGSINLNAGMHNRVAHLEPF